MDLVFFSPVLNHHQVCVADELYHILGKDYTFVETTACHDLKGGTEDYSKRPFLIKAWESPEAWNEAMELAETAKACVFGGFEALPFEKARMKKGLLSFDMGERMLKRGWLNIASPRILQMIASYHLGGWKNKPIYKLCCSAFTKDDQYKLHSYKGRCFKWGYFTHINKTQDAAASTNASSSGITPLMWCGRFLKCKHPELPVFLAQKLKNKGYKFMLDIYGDEGNAAKHDNVFPRKRLETLIEKLGVGDCVRLMGNHPNEEILRAMQQSDIFLFTSDCLEGWGAVANESLANGCALVAGDAIGSSPYLIEEHFNGLTFKSPKVSSSADNADSESLDSLYEKVSWLLDHPHERLQMQQNARKRMQEVWSPQNAAHSLLQLIADINKGKTTSIKEGPCSKA